MKDSLVQEIWFWLGTALCAGNLAIACGSDLNVAVGIASGFAALRMLVWRAQ